MNCGALLGVAMPPPSKLIFTASFLPAECLPLCGDVLPLFPILVHKPG